MNQLGLPYSPCQQDPAKDSKGRLYFPIGQVKLQWHKKDKAKSYEETFYVVDTAVWPVVLGKSALPSSNNSPSHEIHVVGINKQSIGTIFFSP